MTSPRVSVLLPVWNAGKTLAACLRSIERQRESDWECVLVDDGSTDDSLVLAEQAAARDARFRVVPRAHGGLVQSLNAGAALCRAPLVARMDADDVMHRDRLALQCATLDRDSALDAVGAFVRSFPRARLGDGLRAYESWLNGLGDADALFRDRFVECVVAHPALVVRRERLLDLGYADHDWPEDFDLVLRLLARGPCIGVVPRRLLAWRHAPNRTSRRDDRYALDRFTACRAYYLARDFLGARSPATHAAAGTASDALACEYVLWGHGPTARALRRALAANGCRAAAIVEVHPRRIGNAIGGAPVIPPEALATHPVRRLPLIASVAGAKPRAEIRAALAAIGYRDGHDFVCAA